MRLLYGCLVRLHPPAFRRRFAEEMLWIFDESGRAGQRALFFDCVVSIARQWVLRSGSWKALVALAAASVQIVVGGLVWLALRQSDRLPHSGMSPSDTAALAALMRWIVALSGVLVVLVTAASLWFRRFSARRARQA